jgi:hypothetical protein
MVFKSLWSRVSFMVEVIIIVGSLFRFLGAYCSDSVFSAPIDSRFEVVADNINFEDSLSAANVGTG